MRLALPAALAASLAIAAPASAKDVNYHAEAFAKGTYEIHKQRITDSTADSMDFKATFSYTGNYSDVIFRDGHLLSTDEQLSPDFETTTTVNHHVQTANGITNTYDCLGDGQEPQVPGGYGKLVEIQGSKLGFRPGTSLPIGPHGCDTSRMSFGPGANLVVPGWSTGSPDDLPDVGTGPVDLLWNNPPEAIGKDYVEDIIAMDAQQASGVSCPGWDEDTTSCKLTWTGGVKMWKDSETSDVPVYTAPEMVLNLSEKPKVIQLPEMVLNLSEKPKVIQLPEMVFELGPRGGVSSDGSTATLSATCPAGCSGSGTIAPAPAGGKGHSSAAAPRQRFAFTLPARRTRQRVAVKLEPALRRAVRRAKGATVTVTARPKGGKPSRTTLRLRLPAARR